LSECHGQKLIPARQASVVVITIIAGHTFLELDVGEVGNQLRENGSAGIHPPLFRRRNTTQFKPNPTVFSSNRFSHERPLFH
jgi:hypothetical protein